MFQIVKFALRCCWLDKTSFRLLALVTFCNEVCNAGVPKDGLWNTCFCMIGLALQGVDLKASKRHLSSNMSCAQALNWRGTLAKEVLEGPSGNALTLLWLPFLHFLVMQEQVAYQIGWSAMLISESVTSKISTQLICSVGAHGGGL